MQAGLPLRILRALLIMFTLCNALALGPALKRLPGRQTAARLLGASARSPKPLRMLPTSQTLSEEESSRADRCVSFLNASSDPFHCVDTVARSLQRNGFHSLDESVSWSKGRLLQPGGKYYFTREGSSIVAFTVGEQFKPGGGFKILGAHTDSPTIRLRPRSRRGPAAKMIQLNVDLYGGGIWQSWLDRDLSLSGRVLLRREGRLHSQLVRINRPIVRIPSLCIHLRNANERDNFPLHKEDHLVPVLCQHIGQALSSTSSSSSNTTESWEDGQEPELLRVLSEELHCSVEDIAHFELSLFDTQQAARTGINGEYLCSARLDNLASCFVLSEALIDHSQDLSADHEVSMMALFDHEEVGSESTVGAGSALMADTLHRILAALGDHDSEDMLTSKAKSMILSVDMAHALHPNFLSRHERQHAPSLNAGLVVKSHPAQRYATRPRTAFLLREIAQRAALPLQEFVVRNDCPCGSTIGPTLSARTGIRAVDVGMPMLSMHSVREMMGGRDLSLAHAFLCKFLADLRAVDDCLRGTDAL